MPLMRTAGQTDGIGPLDIGRTFQLKLRFPLIGEQTVSLTGAQINKILQQAVDSGLFKTVNKPTRKPHSIAM